MNPEARGICGRCGMVHDHNALRPQTRQGPSTLKTSMLLVCRNCFDLPMPWFRTLWLPEDPPNVAFPSPEPYAIDEAGGGGGKVTNYVIDQLGNYWIDENGNRMVG